MSKKQSLNLLFIGNSHTYYNDMPLLVKRRAEDEGIPCHVTMIAHPGWFLSQHIQPHMNEVHRRIANRIDALLAPVGEEWWGYMKSWPDLEMYDEDGAHASRAGSDFAAKHIWETIRNNLSRVSCGMLGG